MIATSLHLRSLRLSAALSPPTRRASVPPQVHSPAIAPASLPSMLGGTKARARPDDVVLLVRRQIRWLRSHRRNLPRSIGRRTRRRPVPNHRRASRRPHCRTMRPRVSPLIGSRSRSHNRLLSPHRLNLRAPHRRLPRPAHCRLLSPKVVLPLNLRPRPSTRRGPLVVQPSELLPSTSSGHPRLCDRPTRHRRRPKLTTISDRAPLALRKMTTFGPISTPSSAARPAPPLPLGHLGGLALRQISHVTLGQPRIPRMNPS